MAGRNSTSFQFELNEKLRELYASFKDVAEGEIDKEVLKYYQYLVREYVLEKRELDCSKDGARGLLIYHQMGLGKTFLAQSILLDSPLPVILLGPKSLHANFDKSLTKLAGLLGRKSELPRLRARVRYVTMDAHNMAEQLLSATRIIAAAQKRDAQERVTAGALDGILLIVDEAHLLFRAIINSASTASNARKVYDMVMNSATVRLLFLTGTPASKNPFELVPCFNMLAGWELLPTHYDVFMKSFVTNADGSGVQTKIKNADKLANRLVGMVSYADYQTAQVLSDEIKEDEPKERTRLPKQLPLRVERVEMSEEQYRLYLMAREKEEAEGPGASRNKQGKPTLASLVIAKTDLALPGVEREGGSTYHARSRAFADFAPPPEYTRPAQLLDPQSATAFDVRDLPADAFNATTSAKVAKFMDNIRDSSGPIMLYSQFVQMGLNVAARFLENAGYALWRGDHDYEKHIKPLKKKYAIISGEVPPEERSRIVEAHNRPDKPIHVILVSKTGSTGLDLVGGREVHILEPYWEKSLEAQVAARYIRLYKGTEEFEVKTILYIAVANDNMISGIPMKSREVPVVAGMPPGSTVDECLHERALRREVLNKEFRDVLRRVAIECTINAEMQGVDSSCYTCRPTGRSLFHTHPGGLAEDLKLPNPCEPISTRTVSVKELKLSAEDRDRLFPDASDTQVRFQKVTGFALGYQFFVRRDPQSDNYEEVDPASNLYVDLYNIAHPSNNKK